ncbi:MAG: hypothetical protein CL570_06600 [Alphaproteobacteria bacterium]|nr:hypothetical protein [Alphaproteobacteria bacterium]HCQ71676.1 hypothetical protein [Rhodospirillaceae bacterium]
MPKKPYRFEPQIYPFVFTIFAQGLAHSHARDKSLKSQKDSFFCPFGAQAADSRQQLFSATTYPAQQKFDIKQKEA